MRITVTWMDDRQEIYDCPDYRIQGGLLYLDGSPGERPAQPDRVIPLCNVRIFTE